MTTTLRARIISEKTGKPYTWDVKLKRGHYSKRQFMSLAFILDKFRTGELKISDWRIETKAAEVKLPRV